MPKPLVQRNAEELARENTDLQRVVEELRQANAKLKDRLLESSADLDLANEQMFQLAAIVESSEDAIIGCTPSGLVTIWNQGAERLFGYSADEVMGEPTSTNARLNWPEELRAIKKVRNGEHVPPFETVRRRKDGKEIHVSVCVSPIKNREGRIIGASAISRDISERKRLEEHVRQAQKMESIGQLAGGVAHDFNNLLTIISGYSDLLLSSRLDESTKGVIKEIYKAGERAGSLTRQLLAFSRKQVLEPRVLDLNATIADTEKMLRRLIGEDVLLATALDPGLEPVKVDPGQIEQVIINLAVNARDAMPRGGKLTIETANVQLDETCTPLRPEVQPGRYVMLAVSDTGCGMTEEVQTHIFEPFFTTKGPGQGTGLGLATVYGIIKQSGGHIYVYSERGRGATFKIYLPVAEEGLVPGQALHGLNLKPTASASETILLVEDEDPVRAFTRLALQMHGYKVLEASRGDEAVRLCEKHQGPIHLLVTDVVMPEMGGREVAQRLGTLKPGIKVLYLSGYTDDAVVRHGVLEAEAAFLQKPFTSVALATKVGEVLAGKAGPEKKPCQPRRNGNG
jgi:two-component system cell cycle sensor histidine kinase/response regulator CckA